MTRWSSVALRPIRCALECSPVLETCWRRPTPYQASIASQSRVDRFALQGQHAEDALVNPSRGFSSDEAFQGLNPQSKLADGQGPLA